MVYETILKGLSLNFYKISHIILTSDGDRAFYSDLSRMLELLVDYEYFYVVVWYHKKFHAHLLVKDCPFRLAWFDSNWLQMHGCIARFVSVDNYLSTAIYFSTQDSIDFVFCTKGWC